MGQLEINYIMGADGFGRDFFHNNRSREILQIRFLYCSSLLSASEGSQLLRIGCDSSLILIMSLTALPVALKSRCVSRVCGRDHAVQG